MANFIERLIKLTVNNSEANTALNKTATNLDKVDKNTTKVTQSTKTLTNQTHSSTEAIVKNGGAMGLLNELTGGLAMTFKDASEAIGLAGVSLNSFKGIMIATGIGALVIAVGYLASNWEAVADAITGAADAQEKYNAGAVRLNQEREKAQSYTDNEVEAAKLALDIAKKQGKSKSEISRLEKELNDITIKGIEKQIKLNDDRINGRKANQRMMVEEITGLNQVIDKDKERNDILKEIDDLETKIQKALEFRLSANLSGNQRNINIAELRLTKLRDELQVEKDKLTNYDANNEAIKERNKLESENNNLEKQKLQLRNANILIDVKEPSKAKLVGESELSKNYKKLTEMADLAQKKIDFLADKEYTILDPGKLPDLADIDLMRADKFKSVIDNENKWYDERLSAFEQFNKHIQDSTTLSEEEKTAILYDSKIRQTEIEQEKWDYITNASANAAQDILNIASLFGEKSKKDSKRFAIASVIIEQARATGEAINNLVAANAKAVAASPTTFGQPWVTINTVSTALGIAGGIASAAKSIRAINSETLTNDTGSATGGGGAAAPQAQFNIVGASGNNQLAAAIGAAQNKPVNAYVVGSDMTTQQALDRNRITTATFLTLLPFIGLFLFL